MKTFVEEQKIQEISVKELVLWTENPRDEISSDASNEEIIKLALENKSENWQLKRLALEMGEFFDFSEIPTVVYKNNKPIVYDGNCRVMLAMLKLNIFRNISVDFNLPDVKDKIPCNVCSETVALQNIFRKHSHNGSWRELERDKFLSKFMNQTKSDFLVIDEATKIVSENIELNKDFVKREVFSKDNLTKMGFKVEKGQFKTKHNDVNTKKILDDIIDAVKSKKITTRSNRGDVFAVLSDEAKSIIDSDKDNKYRPVRNSLQNSSQKQQEIRLRKRTKEADMLFFGKKLALEQGVVNDLYRDILSLYNYYKTALNKSQISKNFIGIIRMSLRLIVESAAHEKKYDKIDDYIRYYYVSAKSNLSQDMKTFLHENGVSDLSLVGLLNTGAHNYSSSLSEDKAVAMSIIIGEILELTYGVAKKC